MSYKREIFVFVLGGFTIDKCLEICQLLTSGYLKFSPDECGN
ncbi:hypothetical protein FDUTEX481_01617 [Tolypothrix sp. PCC 7601]|nr:hypothetical protein FDUTEX481_01617 [Tolypothrix sp. PCC 7601]